MRPLQMLMFARTRINTRISHKQASSFISAQYYDRKTLSTSIFNSRRIAETSEDTNSSSGSRTSSTRHGRAQYKIIEDVENLDRYCLGGYYPLQIGNDLDDGQYRIVDKLGYGGYSTIWLARDLRRARYVAVKAITADASVCTPESSLIHCLVDSPSKPGKEIIPYLIDEFWVAGPNGKHRCIVTAPAQMSLLDAKEASIFGLFQPRVAQSIIAQLIRGVAFLHSENFVHGDLHLGNILVQFPKPIDGSSTADLRERFGEPEPEAVVRLDGKPLSNGVPSHVFPPGWFGVRSDEIAFGEEKIILSDFGESFNPHKTLRFSSKTLPLLQPPEARFSGEPLSFASDIWTLACTIWEVLGQRPLFEAFFPNADRVTAEQVEVLGVLPPEWWAKWSRRMEWFNEEGELHVKPGTSQGQNCERKTWARRFDYCIQGPRGEAGLETVSEIERKALEEMLRSMLVFQPQGRATAQQALHSKWMTEWGQPALQESWNTLRAVTKGEQRIQEH